MKLQNNKNVIKKGLPCLHKRVGFSRPQSKFNSSFVSCLRTFIKLLGHVIHFWMTN